MNEINRIQILQLPFSEKELYAQSRKATSYSTYLSWFVIQFRQLDDKTRKRVCIQSGVHREEEYMGAEDDSVISNPVVSYHQIMKMGVMRWRGMSRELKCGWKERAEMVNSLPILGRYTQPPEHLIGTLDTVVVITLNQEFNRFAQSVKISLRRSYKNKNYSAVKSFGMERVTIGYQIFKSFFISHLLTTTFFGPSLCFLRGYEIVAKCSSSTLIHLHSRRRIIELFTENELCAFEYMDGDETITVAAKIILNDLATGKEIYGYVVDEYGSNIDCKLADGSEFKCKRPDYLVDMGSWLFYPDDDNKYKVIHYSPIRIRLLKSGNCQMTYNRFKLRDKSTNIISF